MHYIAGRDVHQEKIRGCPLLITPQNGRVLVDPTMLSLWETAQGHTLPEILSSFHAANTSSATISTGLACLAEAGFLIRDTSLENPFEAQRLNFNPQELPQISAIIITYNGLNWLPSLLGSLKSQSLACHEIIIVDNQSSDGTADWVSANHPNVHLIKTGIRSSFAKAVNLGVTSTRNEFFLILNQDVRLEVDAVAHLATAAIEPNTAAVAACLRLMWAPAFLNGIGNQVRAFGWGSDNFIGYLDLGQFETVKNVPSVCFAAALINRQAWEAVGPLDEGFSMYYEDSEWSYRARLKGYAMRAAPKAVVYHAFSGNQPGLPPQMTAQKISNVVYGRLRFTSKLFTGWQRTSRLIYCFGQDLIGVFKALFTLKINNALAFLQGRKLWLRYPSQPVQSTASQQAAVFAKWNQLPPRTRYGVPELTWDLVCSYYLPIMVNGQTRPFPELKFIQENCPNPYRLNWLKKLSILWQVGGFISILRAIKRIGLWKLG